MNQFGNINVNRDEKWMRINYIRNMAESLEFLKKDGDVSGEHIDQTIEDLNGLISKLMDGEE